MAKSLKEKSNSTKTNWEGKKNTQEGSGVDNVSLTPSLISQWNKEIDFQK